MAVLDFIDKIKVYFEDEMKSRDLGLNGIIKDFLQEKSLLNDLIEHHRTVFLRLHSECSTGKNKFLIFQLDWHANCSILLLPKDIPAQCVLPDLDDESVDNIRKLWQEFCESHSSTDCQKLMILLSSAMYKILLEKQHHAVRTNTEQASLPL